MLKNRKEVLSIIPNAEVTKRDDHLYWITFVNSDDIETIIGIGESEPLAWHDVFINLDILKFYYND